MRQIHEFGVAYFLFGVRNCLNGCNSLVAAG